jgi:hypothetical protein
MKINIFLIFLHLFFFRNKAEILNFVKFRGDEVEDLTLRLFKMSTIHKFLPTRDLLCLHYMYIRILFLKDEDEEKLDTCRKIKKPEKKEKFLNRENLNKFLKPEIPKFFINYEKSNNYIEKFYRKNIIKKEKSDLERVVIVNILKILLFTIENISNSTANYEYARNYVAEGKFLIHNFISK